MTGSENPQNRDGSDAIADNLGATDAASLEGPDVEVSVDDVPGGSPFVPQSTDTASEPDAVE